MNLAQAIAFTMFFLVLAFFIYRLVRNGGFKGALFGARIVYTVGEVKGASKGIMRTTLKVHVLNDNPGEHDIGIEVVIKSFASYQMIPVRLNQQEANQLAALLQKATTTPMINPII